MDHDSLPSNSYERRYIEEQHTENLNKAYSRMICNSVVHGIIGVYLFLCYIINNDKHGIGINAKFIVLTSACIHLAGFIPAFIIIYLLCKQKKLNVVLYGLFTNILTLLYSPWSLYCLIRFFDSDNHTKNHAGFLYAGMLYLMIESIFIHTIILCILILITVFSIILFFVIRRRRAMEEEQLQRNLQISRLIQRIDLLNITGRRFQLDDICCICMEQFNSNVEVIKLPCDRRHFFHKSCILEWIERSPTCPICKTEISEEMLNNIGISEKSSSKKHSDHEYGGTGNEERKSVHSRATSSSADQIKEKKSESNKKKL